MSKKIFFMPVIAILALILLFAINILLSKLFDIKPEMFLPILGSFLLIIICSVFLGALVTRLTASQQLIETESDLSKKYDNLKTLTESVGKEVNAIKSQSATCNDNSNSLSFLVATLQKIIQSNFGGSVITHKELEHIENLIPENDEIWVLTSALELEDNQLKEIIINNFKKGVVYKYLIPKEDLILQERMKKLALDWQNNSRLSIEAAKKQIQCYLVPKHFVYMTVIIYSPLKSPPTVLVKFPTSKFYKQETYPLIFRVDSEPKEAWKIFLEAFLDLIDDGRKCSITTPLTFAFKENKK